jgi:hypothetical protein
VKKCPYCAEEIQDAAIVCKHCGRELKGANVGAVTVRAKSSGWGRGIAILIGVGVLSLMGLLVLAGVARGLFPSLENRRVAGACQLSGVAIARPHDTPVGGDMLEITNRDAASWDDAQISIYGQITSGPDKGPAGVHKLSRTIYPGVTALQLSDFQTADGARWVPLMMLVEGVGIVATLRGERCEVELSVHKP